MGVERTAGDVMTRDVVTVTADTSVREVARTLLERRISAVPVVDGQGSLLGMVSEDDLVQRVSGPHLPPHIELLGGVIYLENPLHLDEKLRKAMAVTAGEIMTANPLTVEPGTAIREVADLMVRRRVHRFPVVEGRRVVGIVTRHDVITTLVED